MFLVVFRRRRVSYTMFRVSRRVVFFFDVLLEEDVVFVVVECVCDEYVLLFKYVFGLSGKV